jgi:DNA repair protein RadC
LHTGPGMPFVTTAREVYWLLHPHIDWDVEEVWVLALNSQLKVINYRLISKGTVDHCLLHPRDVFRFLIKENASSFILVHNHPSQDPNASEQDIKLTKKILRLSWLHEIPLLDHVILTPKEGNSLRGQKHIRYWKSSNGRLDRR